MTTQLTIAATTDLGRKRKNNEDCYGCYFPSGSARTGGSEHIAQRHEEPPSGKPAAPDTLVTESAPGAAPEVLAVVCDGMGGAEGGEVASAIGVEAMGRMYRNFCDADHSPDSQPQSAKQSTVAAPFAPPASAESSATTQPVVQVAPCASALLAAALAADKAVWDAALKEPALHGMGATLSALWIANGRYAITQVGDSRVYRWRAGALTQLTDDQTVLNRLRKDGKEPATAAVAARFKSTLEQALGSEPGLLKPETQTGDVADGDLYILCSDGLYDGIDGDALATFLRRHAWRVPHEELSARLVRESVERSGRDNTTAVLVAVGEIKPIGGFFGRFF